MASFNSLPNELLPFVFKHLDLADLWHSRLVCKRFKFFIDEVKLNELIISDFGRLTRPKYYYTNESYNLRNQIKIEFLSSIQAFPFNLSDLKYLVVHLLFWNDKEIKNFEKFLSDKLKLVQLQIWDLNDYNSDLNEKVLLKLPKLKVIFIDYVNVPLTIDCPNLQQVYCGSNFRSIKFLNPQSILSLEVEDDGKMNASQAETIFKNVKYFKSKQCSRLDPDFIDLLPNVKRVYCDQEEINEYDDYFSVTYVMDCLISKITKKDFQIFYKDVELIGSNKLRALRALL